MREQGVHACLPVLMQSHTSQALGKESCSQSSRWFRQVCIIVTERHAMVSNAVIWGALMRCQTSP